MRPDMDEAGSLWSAYSSARIARAKAEVSLIELREKADDAQRTYDKALAKCDEAAAAWRAAIDIQTTDPDGAVPAGNPKED